jgi:hypothetical protein
MLILPPGHNRTTSAPPRLRRRERRLVGGVAALGVALAVAVVIAVAGLGGDGARRGCLDVSFASSLGVQQVVRCGREARATCLAVGKPGGFTGRAGQAVAAGCRRLGLRVVVREVPVG